MLYVWFWCVCVYYLVAFIKLFTKDIIYAVDGGFWHMHSSLKHRNE